MQKATFCKTVDNALIIKRLQSAKQLMKTSL